MGNAESRMVIKLRIRTNWEDKNHRHRLLKHMVYYMQLKSCSLTNVTRIFRNSEIERLLMDAVEYWADIQHRSKLMTFIEYVIKSGYINEPKVRDGQQVLDRTTAVHGVMGIDCNARQVLERLFRMYMLNVNYRDERGFTQFHVACACGSDGVVNEALMHGQDPNCRATETGDTPLHTAVKYQRSEMVIHLLVKKGADPNLANLEMLTPLHLLCRFRSEADPDYNDAYEEDQPARELVACEFAKSFFHYMDDAAKSIRLDARDNLGRTALHFALACRFRYAAVELLSRGADPNLADAEGSTALHVICKIPTNRKTRMFMQMLFDRTAIRGTTVQVDARDHKGHTALWLATQRQLGKTMRLLLENGADPNVADPNGVTPLHLSCGKDALEISFFRTLIGIGEPRWRTRLNAQDRSGRTPLHLAVANGHEEIVRLLLLSGADPNIADDNGLNVMHEICTSDHKLELVDIFFDIADKVKTGRLQVEARDKSGRTPLQMAVANFLPHVARKLFAHVDDASGFVLPKESEFEAGIALYKSMGVKFKAYVIRGFYSIAHLLESKGYEFDQSDSMLIMRIFAKHGLFELPVVSVDDYIDAKMPTKAKEMTLKYGNSTCTVRDLLQMPANRWRRIFKYEDYFAISSQLRCFTGDEWIYELLDNKLAEIICRRFCAYWAERAFLELTYCQVPIELCDGIFEELSNRDLYNICLVWEMDESS